MLLSLRGEKQLQTKFFYPNYGSWTNIYTMTKFIKKETEKNILWNDKKVRQTSNLAFQLEGWTRYFRHRYLIKISKNGMDSTITKPQQCFLERCHTVSIELPNNYLFNFNKQTKHLQTSWRRFEDISQDVLKTSWKTRS